MSWKKKIKWSRNIQPTTTKYFLTLQNLLNIFNYFSSNFSIVFSVSRSQKTSSQSQHSFLDMSRSIFYYFDWCEKLRKIYCMCALCPPHLVRKIPPDLVWNTYESTFSCNVIIWFIGSAKCSEKIPFPRRRVWQI